MALAFMNRCSRNIADTDQRTVKTIQKVKPFFYGNIRTYENVKYSPSLYFKQASIFKVSFICSIQLHGKAMPRLILVDCEIDVTGIRNIEYSGTIV